MPYVVRCWDCKHEEVRLYERSCTKCGRPGGDIIKFIENNRCRACGVLEGRCDHNQRIY